MDDLTTAGALDPEQFLTVARFEDPVEAQMAKGMLETAGLECFLQGENANHLLGAAFRARLLVHRRDESAARELLPAPEEEGGPVDEDPEALEDES
ncbi:DUF2007 domain-containing protein [Edaphobacter modestus]|uniref:Putative signal transducing protein n=1 Tax=Edaphobacter modestus TaxID=388466 RepID=A0A4Q7YTT2_9BACT|nr:DUF2007 domain-containing protein [Edaphobacter modestus]RZU40694.1 putative signal transducing protein [Edaphobacter modestus]